MSNYRQINPAHSEIFGAGFEQVVQSIRWAVHNKLSPFYRLRFADLTHQKHITRADFSALPPLSKTDILATPYSKRVFLPNRLIKRVSISSGTTSKTPLIIPKAVIRDDHHRNLILLLRSLKIHQMMVLTTVRGVNNHSKKLMLDGINNCNYVFADTAELALAAKIFSEMQLEAINTTPSALGFLLPFLKDCYELTKIKLIIIAGEITTDTQLAMFKSYFPSAYFEINLGSSETPVNFGYRCSFLSTQSARFFHLSERFFAYELINPKASSQANGQSGELCLTTVIKCAFPLIRYRSGDQVKISKQSCHCGKQYLLEFLGRTGYDYLTAGGANFHVQWLDQVLSQIINNFDGDYQLHLHEKVQNMRIVYQPILQLNQQFITKDKLQLAHTISSLLPVSNKYNLNFFVENGIFLPLQIVPLPKNLDRNQKQIKLVSHLK